MLCVCVCVCMFVSGRDGFTSPVPLSQILIPGPSLSLFLDRSLPYFCFFTTSLLLSHSFAFSLPLILPFPPSLSLLFLSIQPPHFLFISFSLYLSLFFLPLSPPLSLPLILSLSLSLSTFRSLSLSPSSLL